MKAWEIDELRRGVKGKWAMRGEALRAFNGRICTDSRKAAAGDFFIAIKGERFDGHDFVKDVVERDVAAVLVSGQWSVASGQQEVLRRARDKGVAVIAVDDTIAGLNRLAAAYRANELGGGFRAKVIAVGGSNGKTTTKRIIHALLAEKFGALGGCASPKSFNNNIGMPLTLLEVMPGHDYVVLEIGTNAPGEIAALGAVCRPDVAVIVSVGLEHLEKLGDLAGVAREEAAIGEYVAEGGTLIVPAEAAEMLGAARGVQRIVIGKMINDQCSMINDSMTNDSMTQFSGMTNESMNQLVLTDVRETVAGTGFGVNGRGSFWVPLLGEHNAMNALMAVAVARRLGVSDERIAAGLLKVMAAEGRFEPVRVGEAGGGWAVINDAYNANPSSVEASLRTFARLCGESGRQGDTETRRPGDKGRRVVILADMLELGAASAELHRQVGRQVGKLGFELFVAIGPRMKLAAEEAGGMKNVKERNIKEKNLKGKMKVVWFESTAAAREGVLRLLKRGDNILLKGSHGMALETLLDTLRGGG